ncbi:MAG: TonB-dependent receptor [Acidobacteriota bacterium]|nr:TonB-dependent receptor [Acidobacteriota bacterium]
MSDRASLVSLVCGVWMIVLHTSTALGQPAVSGTVVDVSGLAVAGASIVTRAADGQTGSVVAGPDGAFSIDAEVTSLTVTSPGFAPTVVDTVTPDLRVVLRPATFADSVVVTATRGAERLPSAAPSTVLTAAELNNSAAGALDDVLRSTPGFSLFRRNSSRVANPTTQGVTLRGVSGSGASRTVVLSDGVPLNDPFGSWVYWNRIPQAAVDRVEVVRGATGDLYGADALGGVVQVLTFSPARTRARATLEGGSFDTIRGSLFGGFGRDGWGGAGAYEGTATDGAFTVAPEARGPIDTRADSDYQTGYATAGRQADTWNAWIKGALYSEDRGNGTPQQVNTTDWRQVSGTASGTAGGGAWQAQAAVSTQDYYQTFTAVAANRASERLTTEQTTDTTFGTAGGQWTQPIGRVTLLAGGDFHRTKSELATIAYSFTGVPSGPTLTGGTERTVGLYSRASIAVADAVTVDLGGRLDWWRSEPRDSSLPDKSVTFFSPRAAVAWRSGDYALQGAVYYANRPPTLNELHRGFRVGNIITNPNPLLEPETLTGVEGGVLRTWARVTARLTGFYNRLEGAIANVTVSSTPALITRERQNSDEIRAGGVEMEVDARVSSTLSLNGQLVFTSSHFRGSVAAPDIEDNRVPQVPAVQGGAGITWTDPRILTAAAQIRFSGEQFDDDQNQFTLGAFGVVDVQVSRAVTRGLAAFLAVENLFDQVYDTGRTPIRLIGWPRAVRVGLRVALR